MDKEKQRLWQRAWREKNKEKCKEYSRKERERRAEKIDQYRKSPEGRAKILLAVKNWRIKNREHYLETQREYKKKNRDKINARFRVTNAILRGKLKRGTICEICQTEGKMEAHHEDYSKPLDVKWLCFVCHRKQHNKLLNVK